MTLSTVVLPAPERPNSAVMPAPALNAASSAKVPTSSLAASSSIDACGAGGGAAQQQLGSHERGERQGDRHDAQAKRLGVAARHLGEGVDGERQRLRLAGDV